MFAKQPEDDIVSFAAAFEPFLPAKPLLRPYADPLYTHSESPDIFFGQQPAVLSRAIVAAVTRSNNRGGDAKLATKRQPATRVDHKRISNVIEEVEGMLGRAQELHTIKSTPASESGDDTLSSRSDHPDVSPSMCIWCESVEYKVSLLHKGCGKLETTGGQRNPVAVESQVDQAAVARFRQQLEELRLQDADKYAELKDAVSRGLSIGYAALDPHIGDRDWKGKFAPKEKCVLERLFRPNECSAKPSEPRKSESHSRVPSKAVDQPVRHVNTMSGWVAEEGKSNRRERIEGIVAVQRLKRQKRQNLPLELDKPNRCFSTNPDRFVQKRFRMNPRFTWLCHTNDNQAEWRQAIRLGIEQTRQDRSDLAGRRLATAHRRARTRAGAATYCRVTSEGMSAGGTRPRSALNFGLSFDAGAGRVQNHLDLLPQIHAVTLLRQEVLRARLLSPQASSPVREPIECTSCRADRCQPERMCGSSS